VNENPRKKLPPRDLEKRSPLNHPRALKPTLVVGSLFASGALVLALSASASNRAPNEQAENAAKEQPRTSASSAEPIAIAAEAEEPEHIVAPEAPCHSGTGSAKGKVAPVPTTVAIRPGRRPMHVAGIMAASPDKGGLAL
jgi:hypothetical protein